MPLKWHALQGSIHHVCLEDAADTYDALSYVWGPPESNRNSSGWRFRGDQPYNFPQIARQSSTSILNFPGDTLDETETRPETIEVSVHDFIIPAAALAFEPSYRLLKDRPTNHIPDEPQRNSRPGSTEIALRKR